ncbi:MAG: hypothetical protein QF918_09465 [Pirellulaceae bacterium]|jgi:hypothetical protein|nr:hypothetical protein [Pirellulaceae bacterium]MDP6722733.1 hypothetical protein [Pirellulaceae bacterium]
MCSVHAHFCHAFLHPSEIAEQRTDGKLRISAKQVANPLAMTDGRRRSISFGSGAGRANLQSLQIRVFH